MPVSVASCSIFSILKHLARTSLGNALLQRGLLACQSYVHSPGQLHMREFCQPHGTTACNIDAHKR